MKHAGDDRAVPKDSDEGRRRQHGRLPWPTPDELAPDARALYENILSGPRMQSSFIQRTDPDGRLHGPFNALLTSPAIGEALQHVGSQLRFAGTLPDRTREMAILLVAQAHGSLFERYAHEPVARAADCTDDELETIWAGEVPASCNEKERVALEAVRHLVSTHDLDDERFDLAHGVLGDGGLTELVALIGYYELLATLLKVWRTPVPDACTQNPHGE